MEDKQKGKAGSHRDQLGAVVVVELREGGTQTWFLAIQVKKTGILLC